MSDAPNSPNKVPPADLTLSTGETSSSRGAIGPYKLLQKVGEGGMGEVWLAEQTTPIHRTVALKLIKAGMDTGVVVARFESERQALALMDHTNIAKVFDAGSTSDGHPYFVMEYVSGEPITTYCDKHRLPVRERLELFIHVCEGVQHAHQKAIIHRDLKPSNILVVLQDDKAVPKIIDFGLAKAMAQRLTERTIFTELGFMVGTPGYMSPEQADMTERHVDTRTDVYSLGVILYELLVGTLPFDPKEMREAGFEGMLRMIRDKDPLRPSTKILALGGQSKILAGSRNEEPQSLARRLRGDLDWITMRALEKDRTRRYASASELAADIERHLRNEPVLACPPSATYRARKFVRRHRFGVGVSAVAVLSLLGFAVTMTVQARRIAKERDRANLEAETSRRVTEFMTGMFNVSDPSEARGNSITAREILDKSSKEIGTGLGKDPALQARLMDAMGEVYENLGLLSRAHDLLTQAVDLCQQNLGADHPDTLHAQEDLAWNLTESGHYTEAEELQRGMLQRERRLLGAEHLETLRSTNRLAGTLLGLGKNAEAETLYRDVFEIRIHRLGPLNRETLSAAFNLALAIYQQGRNAEAEKLLRDTLGKQQQILGVDHPDTLKCMRALAQVLDDENQFSESEALSRQTVEMEQRVFGLGHPETLRSMHNLALTLNEENKFSESEALYRQILPIKRQVPGSDLTPTLEGLGLALSHEQRYSEAEPLFREAIGIAHKSERTFDEGNAWFYFACGAAVARRRDDSIEYLLKALDLKSADISTIATEADLNNLHDDPRFKALVHQVEAAKSGTVSLGRKP